MSTAAEAHLRTALELHRPGWGLPGACHLDPGILDLELDRIWRRSWLLAGPSAELRAPGDFFSFRLGDDAMLLARLGDGSVAAVHSSCRHRGMPVVSAERGSARRWVCPYHGWSYALDGRLLGVGGAEGELELSDLDLLPVPVVEIAGLVFLWAGPEAPTPMDAAATELGAALAQQGLDRAKVAHSIDYSVAANWKLVWENNRECWHCHRGHPEYITANFDVAPDTPATRALSAARAAEHAALLDSPDDVEVADRHDEPGLYRFPTAERWFSANRTPLRPGFVSESLDGRPVASLMGAHAGADVGTLRLRGVPNFWCHASSDHAVLTRMIPAGPDRTLMSVFWLVDADADVDLERLLPFWQLTSEQDWALCEANHRGVASPAYRPGPLSPSREYNVIAFIDWYRRRMSDATGSIA